MATSFVSEHSVEYCLVPEFKALLEQEFEIAIPLFPWMSREGGKLSREIHGSVNFNVVAMFPRRPKFSVPGSDVLLAKINIQIIAAAKQGKKLGIPMVAGIPFARDFFELASRPKCYWLKLADYELNDNFVEINKATDYVPESGFANDRELANYIKNISLPKSFEEIINNIREIKRSGEDYGYLQLFFFSIDYKPVYFLIPIK
jgi:hypothetical protein